MHLRSVGYLLNVLLIAAILSCGVHGREEVWEQELQYEAKNRINLLIKGLDTFPAKREKFINELVGIYKTKLRDLLRRQLRGAISEGNMQITQGIVEVYTAAGDVSAIPLLVNELLYNTAVSVRLSIILHLPLFCVDNPSERAEAQLILENGERNIPPRLLKAMRSLPLDKQGRYDFSKDQDVRKPVEAAIGWQLQPVEAVIKFGLEKLNQDRALIILEHLIGVDLGSERNSWVEFWRSRRRTYVSPVDEEIQLTQIAACDMLGAIGAECSPELADHCRWIMSTPFDTVRQAVLQMVAQITELSVSRLPYFNKRLTAKPAPEQSEQLWLKRQVEAAARARKMVYEFCDKYGSDKSLDIRMELMKCLAGAAEPEAVTYILKLMRADIQSHRMRLLAIRAFGRCNGERAVRVLTQMAVYRGIAVKRELQIREYQRVRAAFIALGEVLGKTKDGKLEFADAETSRKALEFLTKSLQDSRRIVGAPASGDPQAHTVRHFARQILQESLRMADKSYDPDFWINLYNKKMTATLSSNKAQEVK